MDTLLCFIFGVYFGLTCASLIGDDQNLSCFYTQCVRRALECLFFYKFLCHIFKNKRRDAGDLYNPYRRNTAATRKILNLATNKFMWMNFGLWKTADNGLSSSDQDFKSACEELANLLGKDFTKNEKILDVGCGCGDQDIFWLYKDKSLIITAIDISPVQIEFAQNKAALLGVKDVSFEVGSATDLSPYEPETFTRVLSLDSAYHFKTRLKFLSESHRILSKNGHIALIDFTMERKITTLLEYVLSVIISKAAHIPRENMVPVETYKSDLEECGFRDICIEDISSNVIGGFYHFTTRHQQNWSDVVNSTELWKIRVIAAVLHWLWNHGYIKCIHITGTKV